MTTYVIAANLCLSFNVDDLLALKWAWALIKYGDTIQSLVTVRLKNKFIQDTIFRERSRLDLRKCHYIILNSIPQSHYNLGFSHDTSSTWSNFDDCLEINSHVHDLQCYC